MSFREELLMADEQELVILLLLWEVVHVVV